MTAEPQTLPERALELINRAEAVAHVDKASRLAARYQTAKDLMVESRARLGEATQWVRRLSEAQIPLQVDDSLLEKLVGLAAALERAQQYEGDEFEAAVRDIDQGVSNALARLQVEKDRALGEWRELQPAIDSDFLGVLSGIEPEEARRVQVALDAFDGCSEVAEPDDVKSLVKAADELRAAYADLTAPMPEHVRGFLESVPTGVSLARLNDDVLNWLREKGAESSFVVRLAR